MQAKDTDRVKMGDADWSVECFQCGQTFEAKRSDASFCSAKCRVAFHREPQKIENLLAAMQQAGRQAKADALRYRHTAKVYLAMREMRDAINAALAMFENEV